jgi:hypothetical protein
MAHPAMQNPTMVTLMVLMGAFWTAAYALIIMKGFKDKTYGMPMAALCVNLTWEFIFSFVMPFQEAFFLPLNLVWLSLDAIMAFQLLKYGPKEFPQLPAWQFYGFVALGLLFGSLATLAITFDANDHTGTYSGFGAALLMAVCYVQMLVARRSLRGQNLWIAVAKMLGSLMPAVGYHLFMPEYTHSQILRFLYVSIVVFDLTYIAMVVAHRRKERQPVWAF